MAECIDRDELMDAVMQITGIDIAPVHEDAMRRAREENQKNGVFFKEDFVD